MVVGYGEGIWRRERKEEEKMEEEEELNKEGGRERKEGRGGEIS